MSELGAIKEALNEKMDRDWHNMADTMDYVVEWKSPTTSDPTWYRKYKSGWIEQGGKTTTSATVTLPKAMANTDFYANASVNAPTGNSAWENSVEIISTTQIKLIGHANLAKIWEVKGQGA